MTGSAPDPPRSLDASIAELEQAAERLRSADLDPHEAAELVERCAELAARCGGDLERASRAAAAEPAPNGAETLL